MSLFLEACEICQHNTQEKLDEFLTTYQIDIHEKDDLLLLMAAQNNKIDIVHYLLKKGANPHARNGEWFQKVFFNLDIKTCSDYLDLGVGWSDPLNNNLFRFTMGKESFSHFKLLIDKLYPMPLSAFRFLEFSQYEYLKNSGHFEIYKKQLFNFAKQNSESDCLLDLSKQKLEINEIDDIMKVLVYEYENYPYVFDLKTKELLKEKKYENLKHLPKTIDLFKKIKNEYPDFINYYLNNTFFSECHELELDYLKLLFDNSSLTLKPIIENYCEQDEFDLDKVKYLAKYAVLPTQCLVDIVFAYKDNNLFNELLDLISENKTIDLDYQEKISRLAINAHLLNFENLSKLHEKNNTTSLDIELINACKEENIEKVKLALEKGANVNCDGHICLYESLEKNNNELIKLIINGTYINSFTLQLSLITENKLAIMYFLEKGIAISLENFELMTSMQNNEIVQDILTFPNYKKQFINIIEENWFFKLDYKNASMRKFYIESIACNIATQHTLKELIKISFYIGDISNEVLINKINDCDKFKKVKPYYFHHHLNKILTNKNYELFDYLVDKKIVTFHSESTAVVVTLDYNNALYLINKFKENEKEFPLLLELVLKNNHVDLFETYAKQEDYDYIELLKHSSQQKDTVLTDVAVSYILDKIFHYQMNRLPEIEEFALKQASDMSKKLIEHLNIIKEKNALNQTFNLQDDSENKSKMKKRKI